MWSSFSHVWLFATLWTAACQPGFSVHGILQARMLEWVAMSSSRGSSQPKDRILVSCIILQWHKGSSPLLPPGKPLLKKNCIVGVKNAVIYLDKNSSVHSLSHVWLFATPWIAECQASLSITNSRSPPKPMAIELVMPFNHLILCHPLLHLPSIFPSIRVFSNESALLIRWPKY